MFITQHILPTSKRSQSGTELAACHGYCRRSAESSAAGQGHLVVLPWLVAWLVPALRLLVLDDGDLDPRHGSSGEDAGGWDGVISPRAT
jgi:hypothetical protein